MPETLPPRAQDREASLTQALHGTAFGHHPCYAFQEIPSTMDLAHRLAHQGANEGTCVWAETQTGGRGRAGRTWVSPPGGLYLSVVLRPTRPLHEVPQLALVAGLAAAQAIHEVTHLNPMIRWPNDVLFNGQKVGGILVEVKSDVGDKGQGTTPVHAVVGMGVNVTTNPKDLPEGATSLGQWTPSAPDRLVLAATLVRHLEQHYRHWSREGFASIRPSLLRWTGLFGQLVHITTAKAAFEGQAIDLDETGRLLVRLDSGIMHPFDIGEVTLLTHDHRD